ncbi:NAD(P)/FAD-dependent oxidoreductase [Phenylobacterium montanum]|uniref:FAD-binding oxidoreductase n=1 Tax=Phenylobacterium montanum TaxID=2823693 RepID=A0A975IVC2_9CAUL|nr:FAD-binding oxidoreductase [Caulobacter sp. S6]QUD88847.1 FAD-binding oxidoreductase [Caulobacter sp. S6]
MGFNQSLNMDRSYYVATAHDAPSHPQLTGETEADLVVVGGGATGLSAALHAAEAGLSVVLLEGGRIGWGASGRNGGQMIPGLRKGALELIQAYGRERAQALFHTALEARDLVGDLIRKHAIDCDLVEAGHLLGAVKAGDIGHLEDEVRCLAEVMGYRDAEFLTADQARAHVDTPYAAGLLDRRGGHFHTLNFTLGLARAATSAGVRIFERSVATSLKQDGKVRIGTAQGGVTARHAILAGDALLTGLMGRVNSRIMPVANYVVATEPLAEIETLIPTNVAVSDTRFVVNYYRRTADGRILFGGGERYTPDPPRDMAAFTRPHLEGTFPQLKGVKIDYAWGGLVSVTTSRLPHVGRQGEVLFAHGYSGMGAILSTLGGKLMVEAIGGNASRFDLFAGVEPMAFPGGMALRGPLHVLGMLWYALRDRL